MNVITVLLILDTILQVVVCHFSLWWLIVLIARIFFAARLIGAVIKTRKICVAEAVAFGCMLIWHFIFSKGSLPWKRILLFGLFSLFAALLMFLDDLLYVYVIVDDEGD